jgi:hypothetical protein
VHRMWWGHKRLGLEAKTAFISYWTRLIGNYAEYYRQRLPEKRSKGNAK